MYREAPDEDNPDSGWRFLSGNEDEAYMNESSNHSVFPSIQYVIMTEILFLIFMRK